MSAVTHTVVSKFTSDGRRYLAGRPATLSIVWGAPGEELAGGIRRRQVDGGVHLREGGVMPQDEYFEAEARLRELAQVQAKWNPIPHERRVRWCQMQLDFPPVWFGAFPMIYTARAVQRDGYTNITEWVDVAHDFEDAGFAPEQYYLLRMCIRACLRVQGGEDDHRLLYSHRGNRGGPVCRYIKGSDWVLWPALVDSGMTPLRAAGLLLDGGKKEIPDGMILDRNGQVALSTDD